MEEKITKLSEVWAIAQNFKNRIREVIGPDFFIDIQIEAHGDDHPLAIEARTLNWKPEREKETAWYKKSDEFLDISVFCEKPVQVMEK